MRQYLQYASACIRIALDGSLQKANNWSVLGVAIIGALLQYSGQKLDVSQDWPGTVTITLIYVAVAWFAFFLWRLIFVAPYRLYQKYKRPPALEQLNKYYVEIGTLIEKRLQKDDLQAFESYVKAVQEWVDAAGKWVGDNLGQAAQAKFLDRTGILSAYYSGAINDQHNTILQNLVKFRKNLAELIEKDAWR
jgi:hypothetical protein